MDIQVEFDGEEIVITKPVSRIENRATDQALYTKLGRNSSGSAG